MKKCVVALVSLMVALSGAVNAEETGTTTSTYRRVSTVTKTDGRGNTITNNFYYNQGAGRANAGKNTKTTTRTVKKSSGMKGDSGYAGGETRSYKKSESTYTKKKTTSQMRKYFLAHPFFQPLKGKFGSVTDISFAQNSFKFDLLNGTVWDIDPSSATYSLDTPFVYGVSSGGAKIKTNQFLVKEDFSFGISDSVAILAMAQYDSTKVKLTDWTTGEPDASTSDSGFNTFGFGLQYRFVDTNDYIGMLAAYYQNQRDTANTFMADLKFGYKIDRTTLYGLGRVSYIDLTSGNAYGAFIQDKTGDWLMMSYNTDVDSATFIEGGVGVFGVLNKYFTLNGEVLFGNYDWHNQLTLKGAFGYQPGDMFALNLYGSAVVYDSADGKVRKYYNNDVAPYSSDTQALLSTCGITSNNIYTIGDYKIKNYNEYKLGIQAILYF
ncbi:MAG: hypothetical protein MJ165_00060 [Alphaproteobacteria bacterium]|nr:hypothetical protein [Alphaproteobacteria bacterium]